MKYYIGFERVEIKDTKLYRIPMSLKLVIEEEYANAEAAKAVAKALSVIWKQFKFKVYTQTELEF